MADKKSPVRDVKETAPSRIPYEYNPFPHLSEFEFSRYIRADKCSGV